MFCKTFTNDVDADLHKLNNNLSLQEGTIPHVMVLLHY